MSGLFHGLSAFPITPCTSDGTVIEADFTRILERLAEARVQSAGVLGSTGTYAYLERDQRRRAIEIARATLGTDVPLIAGIGHLRTDRTIELAQDAQSAGAKGLLLAPVSYTPLLDHEFQAHVASVAASTDLPICIYNNPGTTHFTVSDDLLVALSKIDGVQAIKHPGGPQEQVSARLQALHGQLPNGFAVGFSGDWVAAGSLLAGGKAWYSVIGGLLPRPTLALAEAALSANKDAVADLGAMFAPLWSLFQAHSSFRVVYAAANSMGLTEAQPPRPILAPDTKTQREIEAAIAPLIAYGS